MQFSHIAEEARQNDNFRKVLFTNDHSQVVVMSLNAGEDIGRETHPENDQVLWFVEGEGSAEVGGETQQVREGDIVIVPAGVEHNFTNTGENKMKLVTIYGPADHPARTVHATKEEAEKDEHDK